MKKTIIVLYALTLGPLLLVALLAVWMDSAA